MNLKFKAKFFKKDKSAKFYYICNPEKRRGVRVAERASLESLYTRKGIAGSNPALSADE
jgi:hypothetical protein